MPISAFSSETSRVSSAKPRANATHLPFDLRESAARVKVVFDTVEHRLREHFELMFERDGVERRGGRSMAEILLGFQCEGGAVNSLTD